MASAATFSVLAIDEPTGDGLHADDGYTRVALPTDDDPPAFEGEGATLVGMDIDKFFIVLIPEKVELYEDTANAGVYTNTATIGVDQETFMVGANDFVVVEVCTEEGLNDFTLDDGNGNEVAYTITNEVGNDITDGDYPAAVFYIPDEDDPDDDGLGDDEITFTTTEEVKYAGAYTDTVTFDISLETLV